MPADGLVSAAALRVFLLSDLKRVCVSFFPSPPLPAQVPSAHLYLRLSLPPLLRHPPLITPSSVSLQNATFT